MSKNLVMPWIALLPDVDKTPFLACRDEVQAMIDQADELAKQAAEWRSKAYRSACQLEGIISSNYPRDIINKSKRA